MSRTPHPQLSRDEQRVLDELDHHRRPLHGTSIAVLLGWPKDRVMTTLVHLQAKGQIWGQRSASAALLWAPLSSLTLSDAS